MMNLANVLAQHPASTAVGLVVIVLIYWAWLMVLGVLLAVFIKLSVLWLQLTGRLLASIGRFLVWGHFALQAYLKAVGLYNLAWSLAQRDAQPPWGEIEVLTYRLGDCTLNVAKYRLAVALGRATPAQYAAAVVAAGPLMKAAEMTDAALRAKLA